jgi:hypothetical protein
MATELVLREGTQVTLVIDDKSYLGILRVRDGNWYIELAEGGEIEIHKREGA